jgi:membrane fusion protein, multidrug efflux system
VKIAPVTVALSTSNSVGITSGIQPGDVVVTDGTDKLQEGSKVEPHSATGGSTNAQGQQAPNSPTGQTPATAPYQPQQPSGMPSQSQPSQQPAQQGTQRGKRR